ncbi:MAG TPA: GNAT family N-acetyltransferase [Candidatus Limnocylindrales bacterium]
MPESPIRPVISDATERGRYEAHVDGDLAGILEYVIKYGRLALVHTEVLPAHEGQGVGSALVRHGLDVARASGFRVIAVCPYVQRYLVRHPEHDDIVVGRGDATAT